MPFQTVAIAGSRRLSLPEHTQRVQQVARALAEAEHSLSVGCCTGVDAEVLALVASGAISAEQVSVFAAFGPVSPPWPAERHSAPGAWSGSAVAEVSGALLAGARVSWWSGGPPSLPLRVRLAERSRVVVESAEALVAFFGSPGSRGTLHAARVAAGSGRPVFACPLGFLAEHLPSPGAGVWSPFEIGRGLPMLYQWNNSQHVVL